MPSPATAQPLCSYCGVVVEMVVGPIVDLNRPGGPDPIGVGLGIAGLVLTRHPLGFSAGYTIGSMISDAVDRSLGGTDTCIGLSITAMNHRTTVAQAGSFAARREEEFLLF